jgi:hypothetical protein
MAQIRINTRTLQAIMRGEVGTIRKDLGRFRYRQNVSSDNLVKVSHTPLLRSVDAARGGR